MLPWSILFWSSLLDSCGASQQGRWRGSTSRPLCCPAPRSWQWQCMVSTRRLVMMTWWWCSPGVCIVCSWTSANWTQSPAKENSHEADPILHYQVLRNWIISTLLLSFHLKFLHYINVTISSTSSMYFTLIYAKFPCPRLVVSLQSPDSRLKMSLWSAPDQSCLSPESPRLSLATAGLFCSEDR